MCAACHAPVFDSILHCSELAEMTEWPSLGRFARAVKGID